MLAAELLSPHNRLPVTASRVGVSKRSPQKGGRKPDLEAGGSSVFALFRALFRTNSLQSLPDSGSIPRMVYQSVKMLVTSLVMLSSVVLLSGCWHPTVATVQPPTVPGYSHLLAIPMQDDDGVVNDWATTLYVPIHVDPTKKGQAAFCFGEPVCMPHIPSRLSFVPKWVWGKIKNGRFEGKMIMSITNVHDNPFWGHAILKLSGDIPSPGSSSPAPVQYTILNNFDISIHPKNAWYSPPWYQFNMRLNLLPQTSINAEQ